MGREQRLGTVVHTCNPSTEGPRQGQLKLEGSLGYIAGAYFRKKQKTKQTKKKQTKVTSEHPKFLVTGTSVPP